MKDAAEFFNETQTEAEFEANIVNYAKRTGWLMYHTRDSRRSAEGFPDWTFVRRGRLIFAELKREKGKVTPAQQEWLSALSGVVNVARDTRAVAVYLWRPSDWPQIEKVLA